jgi:hypothetical protein
MTVEQVTQLIGVSAWPVTALLGLFVLRPYISQLTRAASDLRDLLDRSGEMVGLVGQVTELNEAMADLKAMQQVAQASRPEPAPTAGQPTIEQLWKQLEKQWQETRDRFRAVTQAAGVSVNFIGTVGVRNAANALVEKGVIEPATASAMSDLSAQYQYMVRSPTYRSEYLNENVVAAYTRTANQVRGALKAGL